ncbi:MAG: tetratricopeptide repeat protein, partial [Cyanobacteria bacterium J06635_1]
MSLHLDDLLKQCTVKLIVPGVGMGTGFFVAPGYILTCEHVVRGIDEAVKVQVRYQQNGAFAEATLVRAFAGCDVAVLSFEPPVDDLPCVWIDVDEPEIDSQLYAFGYPDNLANGRPVTVRVQGTTDDVPPYLDFKLGNIKPGMSGAALLNLTTGKVCGLLKYSVDEFGLLGGGGIRAAEIVARLSAYLPEVLEAQRRFHQQDDLWRGAQPMHPVPENLPQNVARAFVGRETALDDLHERLQQATSVAITAIQGMGGIGKTELALQYADRYRDLYPAGLCWLPARDLDVGTELVNFAKGQLGLTPPEDVDLANQVRHCWLHWPQTCPVDSTLIVYDDVTDYQKIEPYLPPRNSQQRFKVLITTRQQHLAATVQDFEIKLLSPEASLKLMRAIVGKDRIEAELATAQALCDWVGYLPLGLELISHYLKTKPDWSLTKLQGRLEKNRLVAKALQAKSGITAKLGVIEAFELSWQTLGDDAQQLACWLSLFALAPIPWQLAAAPVGKDEQDDLEDARDDQLVKLSLVQRVAPETYQLHQLVREFCLAKLAERDNGDELKQAYCQLMVGISAQMPQTPTQDLIVQMTPVMPHIEAAATTWQDALGDGENELLWPFVALARFYEGQGAYAQAEPWWLACVKATQQRFGKEHPAVATSLNNLAGLYESQGRYEAAEPLYQDALALRKRLLGEEHPDVATSLNNLAFLYQSQGRYEAAEPLYQDALALRKRLLGEEHPDVATSLNNLAGLYRSQGRYEAAEPLYQDALALRKRLLGE